MRSASTRFLGVSAIFLSVLMTGSAQERSVTAGKPDPRVGLKAGFHDAGEAAFNLERIASLPKPDGFFDPSKPAGNPSQPERDPNLPPEPNDMGRFAPRNPPHVAGQGRNPGASPR